MNTKTLKIKKHLFIFLVMGVLYIAMEVFSRAVQTYLVGVLAGVKWYSLVGWTSLWMFPVGGLCGVLLGLLNEKTKFHMALNCLFGALIIYAIEFSSGCFFNLLCKMSIWDYSKMPLNLLGQITLMYFPIWYFITPFVMWLDDSVRYWFYNEGDSSLLKEYYLNIFRKGQK